MTSQVSIGMPVYNGGATIRKALDSLLAQSFQNFEIIISDNASTDGTEAICLEYAAKDKRLQYFRQKKNQGPIANFQFVLDKAVGEYFMWAADDDIKSSNFIKENLLFLEANHDYVASVSPVKFEGHKFNEVAMGDFSLDDDASDLRMLKFFTKWHANGRYYSLIRRSVLLGLSFDGLDYLGFDWMIVIYLLSQGKIKKIKSGYIILGKNGESNTTNVFSKYNRKSILYFIFPFKDMIFEFHRHYPNVIRKQRIRLYLKWLFLSFQALRLNISFTVRDVFRINKQC